MFTPPIESDVPLVLESEITIPTMTRQEEIAVRANTIRLIADLTDQEILPEEFHRQQAVKLLRTDAGIGLPAYPSETIAYLAGLVSKYDTMVVRELADLKLYTVNKLLELTGSNNEKIQLGALKLLGEIDGVDSYKKRTEITVQQKSTEDIERELMEKLDNMTIDMGDVEEVEIEDIDAEPSAD
jgi:hypothetical protein